MPGQSGTINSQLLIFKRVNNKKNKSKLHFFLQISEMDHVSETAVEICRICKIKLRRKNYKAHLKNAHPKADVDDLQLVRMDTEEDHKSLQLQPGQHQQGNRARGVF